MVVLSCITVKASFTINDYTYACSSYQMFQTKGELLMASLLVIYKSQFLTESICSQNTEFIMYT